MDANGAGGTCGFPPEILGELIAHGIELPYDAGSAAVPLVRREDIGPALAALCREWPGGVPFGRFPVGADGDITDLPYHEGGGWDLEAFDSELNALAPFVPEGWTGFAMPGGADTGAWAVSFSRGRARMEPIGPDDLP